MLTVAGPVTVTEVAAPADAWSVTEIIPEILESAALTAAITIVPEEGMAAGAV
jgi:hypothetical protein